MFQNNQNGQSFNAEPRGVVTIPFRHVLVLSTSSNTMIYDANMTVFQLGARLSSIAPNYMLWRLTQLRVTLMPNTSADVAVGFTGQPDEVATPANFVGVAEDMTVSTISGLFDTNPATFRVPPSVLRRKEQPWLRVTAVTLDPPGETSAGQLAAYCRLATTNTFVFLLDGTVQFTQPAVTGISRPLPKPIHVPVVPDEKQNLGTYEAQAASSIVDEAHDSGSWADAAEELPDLSQTQVRTLFALLEKRFGPGFTK